jgi:hypothetical protein
MDPSLLRVTQHKEESGKHQLIMTASMKVIRVMAPSGGPTTAWAAAGLEDEASSVQPASCKRRSRLRGACVADGGKSSKLIVCKFPGVNIENPGDALCCIIHQSHLSCHCVKK